MQKAVSQVEGLSDRDKRRLDYFSKQIVDMLAPTNFLATNPDALERALATDGQSLVDGLANLVRDLESNQGELVVTLADARRSGWARTWPPRRARSCSATACSS
jgi:polyhydroxyalkanoate synthase